MRRRYASLCISCAHKFYARTYMRRQKLGTFIGVSSGLAGLAAAGTNPRFVYPNTEPGPDSNRLRSSYGN